MENLVQFPGLGISLQISRVAISIGDFHIYWYGILLALGLLGGLVFAFSYGPDFGIDTDRMVDVVVIGTVMAIICARVYYVSMAPFKYGSLWEMVDLRNGGIAIYGALIGAFTFGGIACKWRRIPLLPMFDLVSMGFLIGQAVGRWGNFVNQEAFGCNTSLPWGMYSEATHSYLQSRQSILEAQGLTVDPAMPVHPTFLYESLWCLAGFLILFWLMKKRCFHGEVFLLYAIWYGSGRFWIEGLRTDSLMLSSDLNLRASQVVAAVTVLVALVLEIHFRRIYRRKPMEVFLAISNLKEYVQAYPEGSCVKSLPADASHARFLQETKDWNKQIHNAAISEKSKEGKAMQ